MVELETGDRVSGEVRYFYHLIRMMAEDVGGFLLPLEKIIIRY